MIKNILSFFEEILKNNFLQDHFIEITLILSSVAISYYTSQFLIKKLSPTLLSKFEKQSQKLFDIENRTFLNFIILAALLWLIDLGFDLFKEKNIFTEPLFLILLSWCVIRGVTHSLDRSLLSRFVNNVLWLTAALFVTGYLKDFSKFLKCARLRNHTCT